MINKFYLQKFCASSSNRARAWTFLPDDTTSREKTCELRSGKGDQKYGHGIIFSKENDSLAMRCEIATHGKAINNPILRLLQLEENKNVRGTLRK
jgi:hypothetical protein